jgi:hypothetical protein
MRWNGMKATTARLPTAAPLIINAQIATTLGLTLPTVLLFQADEVLR